MRVTVRMTNHRVPPYVLTELDAAGADRLVDEWRWGTARTIVVTVDGARVYLARREVLAVEVEET